MKLIQKINQAFGLSLEQITQYSVEEQAILFSFIKNFSSSLVGSAITQSIILKLSRKIYRADETSGGRIAHKS